MRKTTFIVMGAAAFAGLAFAACTNDYDQFELVGSAGSSVAGQGGGTGGTDGGTGGTAGKGGANTGGTAGQGGVNTGGTAGQGGANTGGAAGQGGANTGGAAGTGGVAGQAGAAGQGGATCQPNEKTCNSTCVAKDDPAFGCEDATCTACAIDHATEACASNACAIGQCDQGWGDCAGGVADGCEQELNVPEHCGDCGNACSNANAASVACTAGKCVPTCNVGWADCTQPQPDNGCETDLQTSAANCGKCGNDCSTLGGGPGFVCAAGNCGCSANAQCAETGNVPQFSCNVGTGLCTCSGTTCKQGESCVKTGGNSSCSCNGQAACGANQVCCPNTGCAATCL